MTLAIDGSKYKGTIDAEKVKAAGYDLVFWRASSGVSGMDPTYGAAERACAGVLPIIPFHTGYNLSSGADQYRAFQVSADLRGKKWVGLDIEAGPSMSEDRARAFIAAAKADGHSVLVYGIQSEVAQYSPECDLWIAAWGPEPAQPWTWWQYGSGMVNGIQFNPTDKNRFNDRLDFDEWLGDDMAVQDFIDGFKQQWDTLVDNPDNAGQGGTKKIEGDDEKAGKRLAEAAFMVVNKMVGGGDLAPFDATITPK